MTEKNINELKDEPEQENDSGSLNEDDTTPPTQEGASSSENTQDSTDSSEPKKEIDQDKKKERSRSVGRGLLVFIVLIILVVAGGIYGWIWLESRFEQAQIERQKNSALNDSKYVSTAVLDEGLASLEQQLNQLNTENEELKRNIDLLQNKVDSQSLRILEMSTTSRSDWLLAEAEYLLKLANQRVLIERQASTAIGLLEEADTILKDLALSELFPIRKAIKEDLVALKLSESVDQEGLYLELSALAGKIELLPLVPEAYTKRDSQATATNENHEGETVSTFGRFLSSFSSYVRVIRHSEKPEAILPPDETVYLHMNLRFMLERAQIALLREQQSIYDANLNQAIDWLKRYFPSSGPTDNYIEQLEQLSERKIVLNLPDISGSLDLLHNYIASMHKLNKTSSDQLEPSDALQADEAI
jgi:uroporphyrin-3 C-methyltransferase